MKVSEGDIERIRAAASIVEVIEGYDGWNDQYSRSLLFGYAIAFTHTGVKATYPFWTIRLLGGLLFLTGMIIMAYNMFATIAGGKAVNAPVLAPAAAH